MHAIVLIPDLDLIDDPDVVGSRIINEFANATKSYLHLLDISELLRVVQAAEMISAHSLAATRMEAFDGYLIERFRRAIEVGSLRIEILLRFESEV